MLRKFLSATAALLLFAVVSPAQPIVLPKLPATALSLFKTSEPVSFEVQTAAAASRKHSGLRKIKV